MRVLGTLWRDCWSEFNFCLYFGFWCARAMESWDLELDLVAGRDLVGYSYCVHWSWICFTGEVDWEMRLRDYRAWRFGFWDFLGQVMKIWSCFRTIRIWERIVSLCRLWMKDTWILDLCKIVGRRVVIRRALRKRSIWEVDFFTTITYSFSY